MSESEAKVTTITSDQHVKRDEKGPYIPIRMLPVLDRPMTMRVSSRKAQSVSPTRRKIREEARLVALDSRTTKKFYTGLRERKVPLTRHYQQKYSAHLKRNFTSWDEVGNDPKEQAGLRSLKRRALSGKFPLN